MSTNAIKIDVDGTVTEHTVNNLKDMQALVGGWLEGFGVGEVVEDLGLWAYCNEEGRLEGLPQNPAASMVCGHPVMSLVGPVIFTRPDLYDDEGNATSNPPLSEDQIRAIKGMVKAAQILLG